MIGVIARLTVQEGKEAELEQVMRELAAQVKANEPGCLLYQLSKSGNAREYVMMERYASNEALAAHGQSEHFRVGFKALGALLAGRPSIELLTELS